MIGRNIEDYFRRKRQDAAVMRTIKDLQHNSYQACHGDFAYYPDYVYSRAHEEMKSVPENKHDRRIGPARLAYEG